MIKLSFDSKEISRSVNTVAKVINRRNALPILSNLLLTMDEQTKQFSLIASNGEAWIRVQLREGSIILLEGKFSSVCLPTEIFRSAVDSVPEQRLTCDIDDNLTTLQLYHFSGTFTCPVQKSDEYPLPPTVENPNVSVTFSTPEMTAWLLDNCDLAKVSVGSDELRPVMSNVALDLQHDHCTLVSSDGHTLYKTELSVGVGGEKPFLTGNPQVVLIHSTILPLLPAFTGADEITVSTTFNMATIASQDVCVTYRPFDARYPNYKSVIPSNNPYKVIVQSRDLRSALGRVGLFADENSNLVRLHFNSDKLTATAEDLDFARTGTEDIPLAESNLPDNFTIGVKLSSFLAMLKCCKTDNALLELSDPSRAILIREDDTTSSKVCLIMPMKLMD